MEHELSELEAELLKTISFFEPMTMEFIYLDLDKYFLSQNRELTIEDLEASLKSLSKLKLIKKIKHENSTAWIRIKPPRSLFARLKRLFTP